MVKRRNSGIIKYIIKQVFGIISVEVNLTPNLQTCQKVVSVHYFFLAKTPYETKQVMTY